ncbi:hypothetical protein RND71_023404 [Anisodus tanguticus]|uniref:Uncharacterized protein n=1 Tax=Anisodus tanguticus TaxID=243964 RepID=A0AAE1RSJ0_9SOLA|nr:hypothetical protein RND71_023404 [Anisodus tanguticus]
MAAYLQKHLFSNILKEVISGFGELYLTAYDRLLVFSVSSIEPSFDGGKYLSDEDFWTDPHSSILQAYERTGRVNCSDCYG